MYEHTETLVTRIALPIGTAADDTQDTPSYPAILRTRASNLLCAVIELEQDSVAR